MIAANRARRAGRSVRSGARRVARVVHRKSEPHSATKLAAGGALVVGTVGADWTGVMNGNTPIQNALAGKGVGNAIKQAAGNWNPFPPGALQNRPGTRLIFIVAPALVIGGAIAQKVMRAPSVKIGKHRIKLWGN
jgi:hypothetical protein